MTADKLTPVQNFQQYFTIEFAKTEQQKRKVYAVRYRVYCDEFKYESVDKYPDHEEKDEYDDVSLHCLIVHKQTGKSAGCVRLVPSARDSGENVLLPFEVHCPESIDTEFADNLHVPRDTVCEISRLAVDSFFRRRTGEELTRFGELTGLTFSEEEQRSFSLIAIAAFLAATALTELSQRTNVFAMMEPFLPRLLKRSGIAFQKVGCDVDYRGIRAPYFTQTQTVLENIRGDLKELYGWINEQIKEAYESEA